MVAVRVLELDEPAPTTKPKWKVGDIVTPKPGGGQKMTVTSVQEGPIVTVQWFEGPVSRLPVL